MRVLLGFTGIILSTSLVACGGGGGGSTTPTTPGTQPTPASGNMTQQSVQRSDAQSSLTAVQAYRETSTTSSTPLALQRAALKAAIARIRYGTPAPGCSNGTTTTTSPGANGSVVITVNVYYDAQCTSIQSSLTWTATQNGSTVSGPANETLYSSTGTVTTTSSLQISFYYSSSTLQQLTGFSLLSTSIVSGGQQQGQAGVACTASGNTLSCGVAVAADVYSASLEDGANVSLTATSGASSTVSMLLTGYQGGLNSLSIASATFPFWSISPSSDQVTSVSANVTTSSSGFTLSATDNVNGGTIAVTGTAASATGTLSRSDTGASVGSFTIDANGNGTMTYGNGQTGTISNYSLQS